MTGCVQQYAERRARSLLGPSATVECVRGVCYVFSVGCLDGETKTRELRGSGKTWGEAIEAVYGWLAARERNEDRLSRFKRTGPSERSH